MNSTRNSLQKLIGYDTNLVRVPYGSKPHLTKNQYMSLIDNGYKLWDWNIDSTDTHPNSSSNSISTHTINEVKNYKTPIILFHDKQVTVNALPSILEYLQNNSYIGKTITQEDIPLNWWN
jgi:peptidoglycan/xylan/chitin deacetylase (PgdA/CDA1 family)